jgi:hypothetical protein
MYLLPNASQPPVLAKTLPVVARAPVRGIRGNCVGDGRTGHPTKMPVLYIDGENPLALIKERLEHLGIPKTAELHIWGGWAKDPPPGPSAEVVEEFVRQTLLAPE